MNEKTSQKWWDRWTGLTFCTFALLCAVVLVYVIGNLNGRQAERRNAYPHAHAQPAKHQAEKSCVGMDAAAQFECVYEAVEAAEDTARTEQDLTAQQQSAWGVMLGTGVAFLAMLATFIGLYYVRQTLLATLEAVKDTGKATGAMERQNEIAVAGQRPWIEIDLLVHKFENSENHIRFDYTIQLRNIGKSIAERVWHFSRADFFGEGQAAEVHRQRDLWWHEAHAKGPSSFAIMPGETYSFAGDVSRLKRTIPWFGADDNRLVGAGVLVSVVYKIPGQAPIEDYKRTERFIRFAPTQEDRMYSFWVFENDMRTVEANEITVAKTRSTITT